MATELRPFLTEIADAIRAKKGTTDTINAQNFASEIESIETGGGGATLKGGEGTAVPVDSETTIENIYVDTSLSVDEVATLIQNNISLYPTYSADEPMGVICMTGNQNGVTIMFADGLYGIMNANFDAYFVYDSTGEGYDITEFGFSGWNPDFNGVIEINNFNFYGSYGLSSEIGNENLKSLFSITPFIKLNVELSGEYTAEILKITENGTIDLINDIVNEKKIVINIEVDFHNPLQTLVTGKSAAGGSYLCQDYQGDNVDFLVDIDLSAATDMAYMFNNCSNLTTIPQLDTSKVTNMQSMFQNCANLTAIPQLDTSKVTNMSSMFESCSNLTTIPQLDTSSATNMYEMFFNCYNLTTIPQLDTSNVYSISYMFYGCNSLTAIPQLDTSRATDMRYMFHRCSKLTTIPQLNTSKVTIMSYMFQYCSKLTTIPQLDTSNVTGISGMFSYCSNLTTIPQLNTSKVTSMMGMFENCYKLTTIDITKFNPSFSDYGADFTKNCYSLTKLIIRTMDTLPLFGKNMFSGCYHFLGTTNSTYNPDGLKDGRIYVPDDMVDSLKARNGWSDYADIIVPLSTLVE